MARRVEEGTLPPGFWPGWFALDRYKDFAFRVHDPLTLDLDGDGIETIAPDGWSGAVFDHKNEGISTATGWIKSDDGLLVYDRNGDGQINNGLELFGDNTRMSNGEFAEHGFAALADLDTNGDGIIDAKDEAFTNLKVWRDINHDGKANEGELFTLQQLQIKSLNLKYEDTNKVLNGGNILAQIGSYTKEDGSVHQMGDVNLIADMMHTVFDPLKLTAEQDQQVNIKGQGRVRDLKEAATLSGGLNAVLGVT